MRKKKTHCLFEVLMKRSKKRKDILQIKSSGSHNHPLNNVAHTFAKILPETKEKIFALYEDRKSPSEARKIIEKNFNPTETTDRSIFPRNNDYYTLFYKWQEYKYAKENGPAMFKKLKERLTDYDGKFFYSGNK